MTPRQLLLKATKQFIDAGVPDPETDSALLLSYLCHRHPLSLRLDAETVLDPVIINRFNELAERRSAREPLQYITNQAYFFGRMFYVDSRVLIPRPETELLCDWALEILRDHPLSRVLDLCCGSGCIGITLKAEKPDAFVTCSDLSPEALALAAENAEQLGVDVAFCRNDLLDGFSASGFDLIISNPPYIPIFPPPNVRTCKRRFVPNLPLLWTEERMEWIFIAELFPVHGMYWIITGFFSWNLGLMKAAGSEPCWRTAVFPALK